MTTWPEDSTAVARGNEFTRVYLLYPFFGTGKETRPKKKSGDICSNFFHTVEQSKAQCVQGYSIREAQYLLVEVQLSI
jgi:hypothetical protein